jgi:steroid delta-isomerase-like uncharacterized protein
MSEQNKAVVRRAYEAMGQGDFGTLEELMADDLIEHEEFPGLEPSKEGVLQFFRMMRAAFPDLSMTAEDMVAEGNMVCVRGTMSGTHSGEFIGIPATGNQISVAFADFMRLEGGKLAEHWGVTDTESMMRQLGVLED